MFRVLTQHTGHTKDAGPALSPFAPFRRPVFAWLWVAALLASVGTWFRDVANGWTMIELSPSPLMVALVQAAATLPVFLFSLPAGALADTVDRRWMLLAIQVFLITVSLALATVTLAGAMTPPLLLCLTFAGGVGAAFMGPPWQSIAPELVPRTELRSAIALNSLGINVARAIGPALGGLILVTAGAVVCYVMDAASYVLVIIVLLFWRRQVAKDPLGPEKFGAAIEGGFRFVLGSPGMLKTLCRAVAFFLFASAYWALLPIITSQQLTGGAGAYGLLLGAIGTGAIGGALILPSLSRRVSSDRLVLGGTLATAAVVLTLGLTSSFLVAMIALVVGGFAWICVLTTLNVAAQSILPNWVRGRGLAIYLTAFFGAMTVGSAIWGQLSSVVGTCQALAIAALGAAVSGLAASFLKLPKGDEDLQPALSWPDPNSPPAPDDRSGPAMIQVSYRVKAPDQHAFLKALPQLGRMRRRDGAFDWRIVQDTSDPELFLETFFTATWRDHLRQHQRLTRADAAVQAAINAFHQGPGAPVVRHFLPPSHKQDPDHVHDAH